MASIDGLTYAFVTKTVNGEIVKGTQFKTDSGKTFTIWDQKKDGKYSGALDTYEIGQAIKESGLELTDRQFATIASLKDKDLQELANKGDKAITGNETSLEDLRKAEKEKKSDKSKIRRELQAQRRNIEAQKKELANLKKAAQYQKNMQRQATSMAPFGMGIGMGMGMGMLNPFFGLGGMFGGALGGGLFNSFMPQNIMEPDFSEMEAHINDQIDDYNAKLEQYGITDEDVVRGTGDVQLEEAPQFNVKKDDSIISGEGVSALQKSQQEGDSKPADGTGSATTQTQTPASQNNTELIKKIKNAKTEEALSTIMKDSGIKEGSEPQDVRQACEAKLEEFNKKAEEDFKKRKK